MKRSAAMRREFAPFLRRRAPHAPLHRERDNNAAAFQFTQRLAVCEGCVPPLCRQGRGRRRKSRAPPGPRPRRITSWKSPPAASRRWSCSYTFPKKTKPVAFGEEICRRDGREPVARRTSFTARSFPPPRRRTNATSSARATPGCCGRNNFIIMSSITGSMATPPPCRRRKAASRAATTTGATFTAATSSRCPTSGNIRGLPRGTTPSTCS